MKMKEVSLEEKGVQIRLKGNRLHFRLIKNDKKNNKNTILLFNNSKQQALKFNPQIALPQAPTKTFQ